MWCNWLAHDPNPVAWEKGRRERGYKFTGEIWFEVYDPALWLKSVAK